MIRSIDFQPVSGAGSEPFRRPPVIVPFEAVAVRRVWCIVGVDDFFQRELARQLVARGLPTVVTSPHAAALAEFAGSDNALPIRVETNDRGEIAAATAAWEAAFGAVDVLVEDASLLLDESANVSPDFQRPSRMLGAVLAGMRRRHAGSIVRLWPGRGSAPRFDALDDALRQELAPDGIRLTTVDTGRPCARPIANAQRALATEPARASPDACEEAIRLAVALIRAIDAAPPQGHLGFADASGSGATPPTDASAADRVDRPPSGTGLLALARLLNRQWQAFPIGDVRPRPAEAADPNGARRFRT